MKFKVTKLDARHTGYTKFKYYVSTIRVVSNDVAHSNFNTKRAWCWTQFGPSAERDWVEGDTVWAWDTEFQHLRLYFKSDAELSMFLLRWS